MKFRDRLAIRRGNSTAYWLGLPPFFERLWEWRARGSVNGGESR